MSTCNVCYVWHVTSLQKAKFEGQISELKQKCKDEQDEVGTQWRGGPCN